MQLKFLVITIVGIWALLSHAYAQVVSQEGLRPSLSIMDTLSNRPGGNYVYSDVVSSDLQDKTEVFYDSLESKTSRSGITRFLYNAFIVRPQKDTTYIGRIIDEAEEMKHYAGRTIGDVNIETSDVFEKAKSFVQKTSNAIHVTTAERVIRRDLFFRPGDELDPAQLVRSSQLLRSRKYISEIWMDLAPREEDSTVVDIFIRTRDRWSMSIDFNLGSEDRARLEIYDVNVMGSGNTFSVQTNYDWGKSKYGGNLISYSIPNMLGTFYTANFTGGREFEDSRLDMEVKKDFYLPTDYEIGFAFNDDKVRYYRLDADDYTIVKYRIYDGWAGYSKKLGSWQSSAYLTGRYFHSSFSRRPASTSAAMNPKFHGYETILFGLGLYREKFYAANLIYGFSYKEYLTAGYRAELTMGYNWGEFRNDMYAGLNLQRGGYTPIGYFMGDAAIGTFIDTGSGKWWMSTIDVSVRWFSALFSKGRSRIRQFITLGYTRGWNRGEGSEEYLTFSKASGPRSIKGHIMGRSRAVISNETVLFTPYHPLGFHMALFGYTDLGLIGDDPNIFKNDFFTTIGVGVRLRNERLIFNTIQLRFGIALGKGGLVENQRFKMSSEQRVGQYRFIPTKPEMLQLNDMAGRRRR